MREKPLCDSWFGAARRANDADHASVHQDFCAIAKANITTGTSGIRERAE